MSKPSCWLLIWVTYVFTTIWALLDPGSTLSFVTPLLALTFETLSEVFHGPILVSNPSGKNVRVDRVREDCQIVVCGKTMCTYLVELPMNDYYYI